MDHLSNLNKAQRDAVVHTNGPLLILAGAGAGKTKTITHRILNLIKTGTPPEKILAITFTNKAAKEMRERVMALIEGDLSINRPINDSGRPFVSTFHALGVRILRDNATHVGIPRHFKIYDRADSVSLVKKIMQEIGEDPKQVEPRTVLSIISREKSSMRSQAEFESKLGYQHVPEVASRVWAKYDTAMRNEGALDFDDLLLETALLLEKNASVRAHYQDKWKYVHIDEYQDTNEVQYRIAKCIVGDDHNVCVVGDIDQNIYSWRGATIKNILGFEKDFPNANMVTLEQNYRSTGNILEAANGIIQKNTMRREKNLFTENEGGEKIGLYTAFDEGDEARFITETVDNLVRQENVSPNDIAVLYRANFQSRVLEESFLNRGLSYQVLGTRFFDRREIKDVLSYIQAALNPKDTLSVSRIINVPTRGIGKVTMLKVLEGNEHELTGKAADNVLSFRRILHTIKTAIETQTASEAIKTLITITGMSHSFKEGGEEGLERLENVKELATLAQKYDGLEAPVGIEKLIEDAALATDQDELQQDNGGTKLMTVHASKGLEFDYVFITGLEQGLFPHDKPQEKKEDEEEERRLFYVALTRAKKKVYLSYAGIRTIFGAQQVNSSSEFIHDIEPHLIENVEDRPSDAASQARSIFIDW
jgi:DNA helicase II / ATP-dependent DNA helicase PcrA